MWIPSFREWIEKYEKTLFATLISRLDVCDVTRGRLCGSLQVKLKRMFCCDSIYYTRFMITSHLISEVGQSVVVRVTGFTLKLIRSYSRHEVLPSTYFPSFLHPYMQSMCWRVATTYVAPATAGGKIANYRGTI